MHPRSGSWNINNWYGFKKTPVHKTHTYFIDYGLLSLLKGKGEITNYVLGVCELETIACQLVPRRTGGQKMPR